MSSTSIRCVAMMPFTGGKRKTSTLTHPAALNGGTARALVTGSGTQARATATGCSAPPTSCRSAVCAATLQPAVGRPKQRRAASSSTARERRRTPLQCLTSPNFAKHRLGAQKITYLLTFCPNGGTMIQHINGTYVPICQQIRDFRGAYRPRRGFGGQSAAGGAITLPPHSIKPPPQRRTTEGGTNTPHLTGGGLPAPRPREGGHKPPQRAERSAANGSGISPTAHAAVRVARLWY